MATAEFEIEDHGIHEVQKIVESFVTVEGFSLASVYACGYRCSSNKSKIIKAYVERFMMLHTRINTVFYRNYVPVNL